MKSTVILLLRQIKMYGIGKGNDTCTNLTCFTRKYVIFVWQSADIPPLLETPIKR